MVLPQYADGALLPPTLNLRIMNIALQFNAPLTSPNGNNYPAGKRILQPVDIAWAMNLAMTTTDVDFLMADSQADTPLYVDMVTGHLKIDTSNFPTNASMNAALAGKVDTTITVNGQPLTGNITLKVPVPLYDSTTPVTANSLTETDLHTYTLPGSTVNLNNQKIMGRYAGTYTQTLLSTQRVRVYAFGTMILDTGALTINVLTPDWSVNLWIQRASASTAWIDVELLSNGISTAVKQNVLVSSVNWTAANVIKVTAQSGLIATPIACNMVTGMMLPAV